MTLKLKKSGAFKAVGGAEDVWVRDPDWLPMPTLNLGEQKIAVLIAVFPHDRNAIGYSFDTATAVDWGDGTSSASVTTGTRLITYANVNSPVTSRGYKTCLITFTPVAGQNMTGVSLNGIVTGISATASNNLLDIAIVGQHVTSLRLSGNSGYNARMLERFSYVGPSNITASTLHTFYNCSSLRVIEGTQWTAKKTTFANFIYNCKALKSWPAFDMSAGTDFTNAFNETGATSIPAVTLPAATNLSSMYAGNRQLKSVGTITAPNATNWSGIFSVCSALEEAPALNTANATTVTNMFASCQTLKVVPLYNTALVQDFQSMFSGCEQLKTVPAFNMTSATNVSYMFANCFCLTSLPVFSGMAAITNYQNMLQGCSFLQEVPAWDMSGGTNLTSWISSANQLRRILATGIKVSTSVGGLHWSSAALNTLYTNLASGVTGQTITVTGNTGATGDDPTIATAKGWTVTG